MNYLKTAFKNFITVSAGMDTTKISNNFNFIRRVMGS